MLKRGSYIFSVSLSHSIYSFKITSAVLRGNYVHSSLDWETYPLNETRCFKHKIGIFKDLLFPLIAQRYLKTNVSCIMFWRKITKYDEILFINEKMNLKRFIFLLGSIRIIYVSSTLNSYNDFVVLTILSDISMTSFSLHYVPKLWKEKKPLFSWVSIVEFVNSWTTLIAH